MKVRFDMKVSVIKDIDVTKYHQAEGIDEAIEQDLAQLQDSLESQEALLEECPQVEVTATKLTVR